MSNQNSMYTDIFATDKYFIERWKIVKDKIYRITQSNEDETLIDYRVAYTLLQILTSQEESEHKLFLEPAIRNFVLNDLLPNVSKYLLMNRTYNLPELIQLHEFMLHLSLKFFNKMFLKEDHVKLSEIMKYVWDTSRPYYKFTNQDEEISLPFGEYPIMSQDHFKWARSLSEGDKIDAIKIEQVKFRQCWSRAKICQVLPNHFTIQFLNDSVKRNVEIESFECMPYKSRTVNDFDWRFALNKGDILDVCDHLGMWYNSTVLDSRKREECGEEVTELYIGYRVYDSNGDHVDEEGRSYMGWGSKYDEWLNVTSPRVQRRNVMSKHCKKYNAEDNAIDDSNDIIYEQDYKESGYIAILRKYYCTSKSLVMQANQMMRQGFFENVLTRLNDEKNWCPIDIVANIVSSIGSLHNIFLRQFAVDYIPRLKSALFKNILKSPDSNVRNFTREKIDDILAALNNLLKRAYSIQEKNEMVESLGVEVALMCFKSNFLERKIQGLKGFCEIIRSVKLQSYKYYTSKMLVAKIEEYKVFQELFDLQTHTQLVQRSSDLLRFLKDEDALSIPHMETIWNLVKKGDAETKQGIFKIFKDLSCTITPAQAVFIMEKISEADPADLGKDEIDLVFEITKYANQAERLVGPAVEFMWDVVSGKKSLTVAAAVGEFALAKFGDLMKSCNLKESRTPVLKKCIEHLKENQAVIPSLRIISKVIESFPIKEIRESEKFTQAMVVEELCNESNKLVETLLNNLWTFKKKILAKLEHSAEPVTESQLDAMIGERPGYMEQISERINFLKNIIKILNDSASSASTAAKEGDMVLEKKYPVSVFDLLSRLWSDLVTESLIAAERDIMFKWLREFVESNRDNVEDVSKFFIEKVVGDDNQVVKITIEGFNCFKGLFISLNQKSGKLSKPEKQTVVSEGGTIINGRFIKSYQNSYDGNFDKKGSQETEMMTKASPSTLGGIKVVWDMIFLAEISSVVEKSIEFLTSLYINIDPSFSEEEITAIRVEYLTQVVEYMIRVLNQKASFTQEVFENKVRRGLKLLTSILDESEKKGCGGLKSHSALVKGELLTIYVTNDISAYGVDAPKKIEVKMPSNKTVLDLRFEVARQAKVSWESVKLQYNSNKIELKDQSNGRTLGELRMTNGETLNGTKRPTSHIPQVPLLTAEGSIVPAAKVYFTEWFNKFSTNGKMNRDQCASFINSCTNDNCKGDDRRVNEVFVKWDDNKDGFLVLDNFMEFYETACRERPGVVWLNLNAHQVRNDLKRLSEVGLEPINELILPRFLLSNESLIFEVLFKLLDESKKIASDVWEILQRIPTSPILLEKIINLEGVKGSDCPQWENLLNTSSIYKLLYSLSIIEYLMESLDEENLSKSESECLKTEASSKPESLLHKTKSSVFRSKLSGVWRTEFILYGGFEHLLKIFKQFCKDNSISKMNIFEKNNLSFILRVLKNYVVATLGNKFKNMYRANQSVSLFFISLDIIAESLSGVRSTDILISSTATDSERVRAFILMKLEENQEFLTLVERLKGSLGEKILKAMNFCEFLEQMFSLLFEILRIAEDIQSEERSLIELALCLIVSLTVCDAETKRRFREHPRLEELLVKGIFCKKSINIRRNFIHAFFVLSHEAPELGHHIIKLLLNNIPTSKDDSRRDCIEFYELLCKLLQLETQLKEKHSEIEGQSINYRELMNKMVANVKEHKSTETRSNPVADKILIGYLNLIEKITQIEPGLIEEFRNLALDVFQTCLFDLTEEDKILNDYTEELMAVEDEDINYVKCKSNESRRAAYELVVSLIKHSQGNLANLIERGFNPLFRSVPQPNSWNYIPALDNKSPSGYIGLKNLGCICYMNAMLQQFFLCQTFRYAILLSDDHQSENYVPYSDKSTYKIDDNVLHQFQKMFTYLQLSDRMDYNPFEFCFSFKDPFGQSVNVGVQQDAQEFLNMIFDKLENSLKNTPYKHILEGVYGGKNCTQLVCSGCKIVKSREENFYNLSIEVRNLRTIYESFEKFIMGETISDYQCENCGKKVDVTKRCCISALPNVLIVHMQRIVFDLDMLMNQKINSRLEFPFELNLEPYTREGLEWREKKKKSKDAGAAGAEGDEKVQEKEYNKEEEIMGSSKESEIEEEEEPGPYKLHPQEYYEYRLKGVVCHTGTAEFGHYYSFINVDGDRWFEFNDSHIRDFDPNKIEAECFGGTSSSDSYDDAWGGWTRGEQSKNAYILVYDRKIKEKLVLEAKEPAELQEIESKLNCALERSSEANKATLDYYGFKKHIPSRLYKSVWEDNHRFMLERHLYQEDFFRFAKEIVLAVKKPEFSLENKVLEGGIYQMSTQPCFYEDFHKIPEEKQLLYKDMVDLLFKLVFQVLSHANDNAMITIFTKSLMEYLSLLPQFSKDFLENLIFKRFPSVLELILSCPDKLVRVSVTQVLNHLINIVIEFYQMDLDLNRLQAAEPADGAGDMECRILNFLNYFSDQMATEVPKNWMKFGQYFEFWREFSYSGEVQLRYMFATQKIAFLLDFFLEKSSPIALIDKKFMMGNRMQNPSFDPLLQCVAHLVSRTKNYYYIRTKNYPQETSLVYYDLLENDVKCLKTQELFDKSLRDGYDFRAMQVLLIYSSFRDENFSINFSVVLIRGLNRCSPDDARFYLEAMCAFLLMDDELYLKRLEWVLGVSQPVFNKHKDFAIAGSLEDQTFVYNTTLLAESPNPVLNLAYTNRKKMENLTMIVVYYLLEIIDKDLRILGYLLAQQPPCYLYSSYFDWIRPFLEAYLESAAQPSYYNKYGTSFNREEIAKKALATLSSIEAKVYQKIEDHQIYRVAPLFQMPEDENVLSSILTPFVIGKTVSETKVHEQIIEEGQEDQGVSLEIYEYQVYCTDSKPTRTSNLAFPQELLSRDGQFNLTAVHPDSTLLHFVHDNRLRVDGAANKKVGFEKQNYVEDEPNPEFAPLGEGEPSVSFSTNLLNVNMSSLQDAMVQENPMGVPGLVSGVSENEVDRAIQIDQRVSENPPMIESSGAQQNTASEANSRPGAAEAIALPDVVLTLHNIPFKTVPILRRILIKNSTPYAISGLLSINLEPNSPDRDTYLPSSSPCFHVKPKSSEFVYTLYKNNHAQPWIEYFIQSKVYYDVQQQQNQNAQGYGVGNNMRSSQNQYSNQYNRQISDEQLYENQNMYLEGEGYNYNYMGND